MKTTAQIRKEIRNAPDPERAEENFNSWKSEIKTAHLGWVAQVFGSSTVWSKRLHSAPDIFVWLTEGNTLDHNISKPQARAELIDCVRDASNEKNKAKEIRRWQKRELMRIIARDLTGRATLEETTAAIAAVADIVLDAVLFVWGSPSDFAVMGMGKLGGNELNYSSDVDVIFVYGAEGEQKRKYGKISNHEFFCQLAQHFIHAVTEKTEDGFLYRVDVRLRPEGKGGPLARSLESYENYYAAWGLTWERMALMKARPAAGARGVGDEFIEAIQPFRYPRALSPRALDEIVEMKGRIEQEIVRAGELDRNVKLGTGGIREIEFIAQSLLLLHGGRNPFLQEANTLRALGKFERYKILPQDEIAALGDAYRFFRHIEHRLQIEADEQTHTIPKEPRALLRLARSMRSASVDEFLAQRQRHAKAVRAIWNRLLADRRKPLAKKAKKTASPRMMEMLARLEHGPGYGHVPTEALARLEEIKPHLLRECGKLANAEGALTQLTQYVDAYGARATLFENFAARPQRLSSLLRFFDASRWLGGIAITHPDWLDDALRTDVLRAAKSLEGIVAEIKVFCRDKKNTATQLRLFWQAEMMRIGLRNILGEVELLQTWRDISALTDGVLCFAWSRRKPPAPMALIALGKLGGSELGYAGDADVIILAEGTARTLLRCEDFVRDWLAFLAEARGTEPMALVDLRLRPEGTEGPLVVALDQLHTYFHGRAEFWERQMLTRARFVCGDARLQKNFLKDAGNWIFDPPITADDLRLARQMRMRIERERSKPDAARDFKTGMGGLVDVEFVAQLAQMVYGRGRPFVRDTATLGTLQKLRARRLITAADVRVLIGGYKLLRGAEAALVRYEATKTTAWPEGERLQTLARQMNAGSAERLAQKVNRARVDIRHVYEDSLNNLEVATERKT